MEAFNKLVSGAGECSSGSVSACKCVSVRGATYPVRASLAECERTQWWVAIMNKWHRISLCVPLYL